MEPCCDPTSWVLLALLAAFARHNMLLAAILADTALRRAPSLTPIWRGDVASGPLAYPSLSRRSTRPLHPSALAISEAPPADSRGTTRLAVSAQNLACA